ncbi:sugar kinase [Nesterenkonia ebinurensis]|uniref:sugar kinase n=1 Tax=Nesterenkonia ebinurensis TaxID=2608252 RepID=UPI00123D28CC|nr:sugar kinase [Nesterenkonia ebinurensis]
MNKDWQNGTVLCAGETMALVTPASTQRLRQATLFHLDAAGAESNVAAHLAALGHRAVWFSRLGADELGRRVADTVSGRGVDVSAVCFDAAAPTGVYFKDPGHGVLYYRTASAASLLSAQDAVAMDLSSAAALHVSGITAALSGSAAEFLAQAMHTARERNVRISFDVNYRAPLWSPAAAAPSLKRLAEQADLVFVGRDEAETLWGTETADDVLELLPELPLLVVKDGSLGATEFSAGTSVFEPSEQVQVVEAVGAGDAFAAGYLSGLLSGKSPAQRLRAGHQRAALTLQTTTDFTDQNGATP